MFRNYFTIALRNLLKDKGYSAINIFGLAIGLATCLLITLFVADEFSYDKYNEKGDRIFRVIGDIHINGNSLNGVFTPPPLAASMVRDYPTIENAVRILSIEGPGMLVKKGDETLMEHNATFADSSLFEVFTIPMIAGDPHTALKDPHTMVISESMAKKYFNGADAIGKTLLTSNTTNYKVTGIIKDMPAQSHFHFDFIKSMAELDFMRENNWLGNNTTTYLLAKAGVTAKELNKDLDASVKKYLGPQLQTLLHSGLEDLAKNGDYFRYYTMPLTQIHLHSNVKGEFEPNGNSQHVYIFIVIAVFILLVACVNFMNLSTARSSGRSKEVGVRKVLGSLRADLMTQFLVESIMTSFIALLLAILIAALLRPYFNQLSGKHISIYLFFSNGKIPIMLLTAIVVGLLAGSYPAFYLSSFQPIQTLKGKLSAGFKSGWLRNSLVVFQFTTVIVLIIGTLVIYSQLTYIRNKELGYNRQQVVTIGNTYSLWIHCRTFKENVQKLSGVVSGTMTRNLPNQRNDDATGYFKDAGGKVNESYVLGRWIIDADYIPTLGMKMVAGRNFSPEMITDSTGVLLNETAVKLMGFTDAVNKNVYTFGDSNKLKPFRILGVVKDFHAGTLRDKIEPVVFHLGEERGAISFRIDTRNIPSLIAQIKDRYESMDKMKGQPFLYSFMDDDFNKLYQTDQRIGKICISFACFAILIACLGLFGLVTFAAEQRTKEIGIRKVLGASVGNVVGLLSKDFIKLVLIAMIVAFPIAWWGMTRWLQDFAYRTNIGWWEFTAAGLLATLITLLTVSFRAIKSALANPVKSLRTD